MDIWPWLYFSGGSTKLWAWTVIHTSQTLQCVWRGLVFQIVGRSHRWFLCLRMLGKGIQQNNYRSVILLSVVSKVFEKLGNNRLVDHLENMAFCLISIVVLDALDQMQIFWWLYDRIAGTFNRSGATRAVAFDISKTFDKVCYAGLLNKFKPYGISGQIFGLNSSFLSNRRLWVVLDGKSPQ